MDEHQDLKKELGIVDKHDLDSQNMLKTLQNLEKLIKVLTESQNERILGNTRLERGETDKIVLMKEIGDKIHETMINYWRKDGISEEEFRNYRIPILKRLVNKNLMARWSFESKGREELITLGIGSFRDDQTSQVGQSMLSRLPLIGGMFRR